MKKNIRYLFSFSFVLISVFIFCILYIFYFIPSISAQTTQQKQKLGGLNLDSYCNSIGQTSNATVNNQTWYCANTQIDLTHACQWQYNNLNTLAIQDIALNPLSWVCYVNPTPTNLPSHILGGLNLDGYCQNIGQGNAAVSGQNWLCSNGTQIALTKACQWEYNSLSAISSQDITGNPYSYTCYSSPPPTIAQTTPLLTPPDSEKLGGLDLNGYCSSLSNNSGANVINSTWFCSGRQSPINISSACQWQYNSKNVVAEQDNTDNIYSWVCYSIPPSTIQTVKVNGNKLLNNKNTQVILRGVNRSGTEYMCVQGRGIFDGPSDYASIKAMKSWNINAVNVLLNEDCWLGINGVNPSYSGTNYQQAIINYTKLLESNGIYPVLSYHWGAPSTQLALGQPDMPDADHAADFWQSVASTFKSDEAVILHVQEEPHPLGNTDSTEAWTCWRDGGKCMGTDYNVSGMQSLVNTIRSTGAGNVIGLSGIQFANTMTQFLNFLPSDSLNNLMAMVDVYPDQNPCNSVNCYSSEYAPVISKMPFMAAEFGESVNGNICSFSNSNTFINWMDQSNSGYMAWVWDAWGTSCGDLSLILDYSGTPHSPNGANYKVHLLSF